MALELSGEANAANRLALKTALELDEVTNAALAAKQPVEEGKGLSEANFTSAEKAKLEGIEENATANSADSALVDRANHTGTQEIATVAGLETALANRIEKMIDLETAPVATITSISVLFPGGTEPVVLIPASLPLSGDPYEDVDGRTPYTEDGSFEDGSFYNNRINYSALANQWAMTLDSGEGVIGWDSHRADLTAVGVESWPWSSVGGGYDVPQITPTFTTEAPGIAGQQYRVKESQGRYRHYEKQPDNSIRELGLFDTLGNEFVAGQIFRRVEPEDFADDKPLKNEMVWLGDSGMSAMGDGINVVKNLRWNGLHRIELTEDYINSGWVDIISGVIVELITNSCDVEILIMEDLQAAGFNEVRLSDHSRTVPYEVRYEPSNIKYCVRCLSAQTGGTIRFLHTMRTFNRTASLATTGTLADAFAAYDYADLTLGGFIIGQGLWVHYSANATFDGA